MNSSDFAIRNIMTAWIDEYQRHNDLLEQLDLEIQKIENPAVREKYQQRFLIMDRFHNKSVELFNACGEQITYGTSASQYTYLRDKLDIARRFIQSLGGDPNSLNWLKKSDFY